MMEHRILERERSRVPAKLAVEALRPHIWRPDEEVNLEAKPYPYTIDDLISQGVKFQHHNYRVSLQQALDHAENGGVVASLPYIIARMAAEPSLYRLSIFDALSEDILGIGYE